jgi:uncharacterized protein (DUF58 family)
MRLTIRVAFLIGLGALPLLFMGRAPGLGILVIVLNLFVVAATLADYFASPNPKKVLRITRKTDEKLALGASNQVTIEVRSSAATPLSVTLLDEPPGDFTADITEHSLIVPNQNRPVTITYHVTPKSKGDYSFGDLFVKYPGYLGLIERVGKFELGGMVKVYPNLLETEKYDLLARRGRLQQVGIRSARLRGGGSEFESMREYVPGDEYKKIDWNATARRGKLITRQYEVERSQNIVIMIDSGRNMLQKVESIAKLDYVINTALMLAYVAVSSDDKIGLVAFDADVQAYIPPNKGRAQVYKILEKLYNLNASLVESDYREAFQYLATRWRRRSLIIIFSDLVDPETSAQLLDAIPILEERHRVVCVTVGDPQINKAARSSDIGAHMIHEKAVAIQVLYDRRQAINVLRRRGVWTVDSPPEDLSADLINHYLELKARSMI